MMPRYAAVFLDIYDGTCFRRARLDERLESQRRPQIAQKRTHQGRTVLAETRRREIAELLRTSGAVTVAEVETRFEVSAMTARRDLDELERRGVVRRTHGGAVLPTTSAHEDSFARRLKVASEAKRRLAEAAVAMLGPRESVFLDSSTTSYFVARRLIETGTAATVLTNSLPVMDLIFTEGSPDIELIGVGGTLRRLTRSFVGPFAVRTVQGHFADRLFLSVKGLTEAGMMTDADALEAEVKHAMIGQASEATLLIDRSKLQLRGLSVVASVSELSSVIAHGMSPENVAPLRAAGAAVRLIDAEGGDGAVSGDG
jgi:DeoR/GlpR family transcriptional regulator of sugar metabolism